MHIKEGGGVTPGGEASAFPQGEPQPASRHSGAAVSDLRMAVRRFTMRLVVLTAFTLIIARGSNLSFVLLYRQDVPVIGLTIALLLILGAWPSALRHVPIVRIPPLAPAVLMLFAFVVAASGTWLVFANFDLSRDEFLANFDADVFASGRQAWPIATQWRAYGDALMPMFMRGLPVEAGWISEYLPGNAILRAVAERSVGREWTSPLLSVVAAFALFRIARKLWPETRSAALLPLLLLTLSAQFLVTAMTPFSMTAHLTFNLLWLWCFLQNNRRGDAGALACGFIATGLHQIVFHPLFVAPFIVELLIARRFRRGALFVAGYALICAFWALYPQLFAPPAVTVGTVDGVTTGLSGFVLRVGSLFREFSIVNSLLMAPNLLRFAAWQHPLMLVLVFCSWPAISRAQGLARPLLAGIVLMLIVTFILMPWQGYGWGYRYLHGFLGSFCLLATYGWHALDRSATERRAALTLTTAVAVAIILPFQMVSTRAIIAPYRAASAFIERSDADVVLVDGSGMLLAMDIVRNHANFSQRPKVMEIQLLDEADLRALCRRYDVRLFDRRHGSRLGMPIVETPDFSGAREILPAIGCDKPLPMSQANDGDRGQ